MFDIQYLQDISKHLDLGDWGIKFVVVVFKWSLSKYKKLINENTKQYLVSENPNLRETNMR